MKPRPNQCAYILHGGQRCSARAWRYGEPFCITHEIQTLLAEPPRKYTRRADREKLGTVDTLTVHKRSPRSAANPRPGQAGRRGQRVAFVPVCLQSELEKKHYEYHYKF
jgi:hypothetical protein